MSGPLARCQQCGCPITDDEWTCDECALEDDGQPTEQDEWRDYDGDC